jgi:hypothetical protein
MSAKAANIDSAPYDRLCRYCDGAGLPFGTRAPLPTAYSTTPRSGSNGHATGVEIEVPPDIEGGCRPMAAFALHLGESFSLSARGISR